VSKFDQPRLKLARTSESSYISWSTCKADAFRLMTHHEVGLANCHGRDQFTGKANGVFDDDCAICPSRI
jgi:hypothetical protein